MMHNFSVPTVTADQVNQAFGNAVMIVANGIWEIINPFIAAFIVLFLLGLMVRGIVSRKKRG